MAVMDDYVLATQNIAYNSVTLTDDYVRCVNTLVRSSSVPVWALPFIHASAIAEGAHH